MHMLKTLPNVTNKYPSVKYHTNYHKCSHHQNPKIIKPFEQNSNTIFFSGMSDQQKH